MTTVSNETATATATKGRGGIKNQATGRSDVFHLDPRLIIIEDDFNARDFTSPSNIAHVEWLEGSIASEGVKEPLKVRTQGDRIIVTNGESRLRAVMNLINRFEQSGGKEGANIESVPVRTEDRYANDQDRLFTQLTSNSGKRFEVMEQSALFVKMVKLGVSMDTIAVRANLDKRRVASLIDLQALPTDVKAMIRDERVSAATAWQSYIRQGRDDAKTIEELRGAIDNAEAAGRTKASNKFIGGTGGERRKSPALQMKAERAELIELLQRATASPGDESDDNEKDITIISMDTQAWARIVEMLAL